MEAYSTRSFYQSLLDFSTRNHGGLKKYFIVVTYITRCESKNHLKRTELPFWSKTFHVFIPSHHLKKTLSIIINDSGALILICVFQITEEGYSFQM